MWQPEELGLKTTHHAGGSFLKQLQFVIILLNLNAQNWIQYSKLGLIREE